MTIEGPTRLTVGDNLELTCTTETSDSDHINYSWTITQGQTKKDLPERQKFKKRDMQKSDEGKYTCVAENEWSYGTATVTVNVQPATRAPPTPAPATQTPAPDPVSVPDTTTTPPPVPDPTSTLLSKSIVSVVRIV